MWYAFLQLQVTLQRLYILTFEYDTDKKQFRVNRKTNPVAYWVNGQVLLIWCIAMFRIRSFFSSSETDANGYERFVMDLLYMGLMNIALATAWTMRSKRREVIWFINNSMGIKDPKELEIKTLTPETIAMYSVGLIAVLFPIALSILPFISSDTPANVVLRFTLPASIMENKMTETILSSLYWLIHGIPAVFPIVQLFAVTILIMFDSKPLMKPCYQPETLMFPENNNLFGSISLRKLRLKKKREDKKSQRKSDPRPTPPPPLQGANANSSGEHFLPVPTGPATLRAQRIKKVLQAAVQFPNAYRRFLWVKLIFKSFQRFGDFIFPVIMVTAYTLCVVSTFVVIRLSHSLPLIVTAIMALIDVLLLANTVAIYAFALVITKESTKFIEFWSAKLLRVIYAKQLQACKPIRLWIGKFFPLHRAIVLDHMMQVVDMTANLLMA